LHLRARLRKALLELLVLQQYDVTLVVRLARRAAQRARTLPLLKQRRHGAERWRGRRLLGLERQRVVQQLRVRLLWLLLLWLLVWVLSDDVSHVRRKRRRRR